MPLHCNKQKRNLNNSITAHNTDIVIYRNIAREHIENPTRVN